MKSQQYINLVNQYHNPKTSSARKKQISNKMRSQGILHESIHGYQNSNSISSIWIIIFLILIIIVVIIIIIVLVLQKQKKEKETENLEEN